MTDVNLDAAFIFLFLVNISFYLAKTPGGLNVCWQAMLSFFKYVYILGIYN